MSSQQRQVARSARKSRDPEDGQLQALEERVLHCEREIAHLQELVRQCAKQVSQLEERFHEEVE